MAKDKGKDKEEEERKEKSQVTGKLQRSTCFLEKALRQARLSQGFLLLMSRN